jgi:hypothetical protein
MLGAYAARSLIVHGKPLGKLKLPDGRPVELREFLTVTVDYLRSALQKAIGLASENPTARPLVNWDDLILGGATKP